MVSESVLLRGAEMRISGCIIARDEEENIANCITRLKNTVDEIIVVDTGSEDDTVRIADELGAYVLKKKWDNDFSKAKNYALEHAKGDWIIFLDADEYFHENSIANVRPVIQKVHSDRNTEGILCEIINIDKDNGRNISNDEILRIFRNSRKIRYINKIHEEIRNNGVPLKCANARNVLSLMHTGYSASLLMDKAKRNLELIKNNAEDEKSAYYFATSYFILKDYETAFKYADAALSVNAIMERSSLAYKIYMIRVSSAMRTDYPNKERITKLIDEANRAYGHHPEIAKVEATFLFSEKVYEKALEKYLYALDCQEKYGKTFEQNDFRGSIGEVYCNIGQILYLMNREMDALEYFFKALRSNKYNSIAFNEMFAFCRNLPENETVSFINSIYNIDSEEDIKFIISRVARCGLPKIVLYYANRWNNVFGNEDDVLIYALAAQEKYPEALKIAMIYFSADKEKYAPLIAAVVILGGLYEECERIRDELGEDYFDIVNCYAEGMPFAGNMEAFLAVLSELVKYTDRFNIENYMQIGAGSDSAEERCIAKIFLNEHRYDQTIYYYREIFESSETEEEKAASAFAIGYCYYKLKNYRDGLTWFERAASNGYKENDLPEFLRCTANQVSDPEVIRTANDLLNRL
jgi:glycosyltransferase involved in cell wall biosynthesis